MIVTLIICGLTLSTLVVASFVYQWWTERERRRVARWDHQQLMDELRRHK